MEAAFSREQSFGQVCIKITYVDPIQIRI